MIFEQPNQCIKTNITSSQAGSYSVPPSVTQSERYSILYVEFFQKIFVVILIKTLDVISKLQKIKGKINEINHTK